MKNNRIPLSLLFGYPEKKSPRFSPDGTMFSYVGRHGDSLTIWVEKKGEKPFPLIKYPKHPVTSYQWLYTNKHILIHRDTDGDERWHLLLYNLDTKTLKDITPFPRARVHHTFTSQLTPTKITFIMDKATRLFNDVYTYDIESETLTRTIKNPGNVVAWLADPKLIIRAKLTITEKCSHVLLTRETSQSPWKKQFIWSIEDIFNSKLLTFSTNGNDLFFVTSKGQHTSQLLKLTIATGTITEVIYDDTHDIRTEILTTPPPDWPPFQTLFINKETGSPGAISYHKEKLIWRFFDKKSEKILAPAVTHDSKKDYWIIDESKQTLLLGSTTDTEPITYYKYDTTTHKHTELFCEQPALKKYTLAPMHPIVFTSRDGRQIHGYLTMPIGSTHAPLVLKVHGGPWARDLWGYNADTQFLANRGYGCLQLNYRASVGYGKEHVNAAVRQWGRAMLDDLEDGITWATNKGYCTKDNVAIMGRSYGGYAVVASLTLRPHLFRCGMAEVAPTYLPTLILRDLPAYWSPFINLLYHHIGCPGTDKALLEKYSPACNVKKLSAPLLLTHGLRDACVHRRQFELFRKELIKHNKDCILMSFPSEGHKNAKEENILSYYRTLEAFLQKHLPTN